MTTLLQRDRRPCLALAASGGGLIALAFWDISNWEFELGFIVFGAGCVAIIGGMLGSDGWSSTLLCDRERTGRVIRLLLTSLSATLLVGCVYVGAWVQLNCLLGMKYVSLNTVSVLGDTLFAPFVWYHESQLPGWLVMSRFGYRCYFMSFDMPYGGLRSNDPLLIIWGHYASFTSCVLCLKYFNCAVKAATSETAERLPQ